MLLTGFKVDWIVCPVHISSSKSLNLLSFVSLNLLIFAFHISYKLTLLSEMTIHIALPFSYYVHVKHLYYVIISIVFLENIFMVKSGLDLRLLRFFCYFLLLLFCHLLLLLFCGLLIFFKVYMVYA
jgi:hypothetical protein